MLFSKTKKDEERNGDKLIRRKIKVICIKD